MIFLLVIFLSDARPTYVACTSSPLIEDMGFLRQSRTSLRILLVRSIRSRRFVRSSANRYLYSNLESCGVGFDKTPNCIRQKKLFKILGMFIKLLCIQGLYDVRELPEDTEALHAQAHYIVDGQHRDIFLFKEGEVTFLKNMGRSSGMVLLSKIHFSLADDFSAFTIGRLFQVR